eukprot:gnl/MRDRNA2_/MRDRNA2_61361_c0_seq1.p1 gnl/MRDRNA2_/MRDRNA2_61361_c0~~gnl/MRDRNA2_/MRDRNA2_61361_c0_seq1.p1  ORF type:complete len:247 (+),score=39.31 gnl/MRDRNA2_/MRDRNA2_61361_c0_seq1:63-803(+)
MVKSQMLMASVFCSTVCCRSNKLLETEVIREPVDRESHIQMKCQGTCPLNEEVDAKQSAMGLKPLACIDEPRFQVVFSESENANASTHTVTFADKPLGLSFANTLPLVVATVDDAAVRLDVKPGWVITSLNGQDITGMKYDEVFQLLMFHMSKLPVANPVVKIMFDAGKDYYLPIVFTRKPLGIGISGFPLKVCSVEAGGAASLKAIKPGWQIISINDKDVTRAPIETFEQAVDVFQNAVSKLSQT